LTIATYLTFVRLIISPIFLVLYIWHDFFSISSATVPYFLIALLLLSELTDAFDGYLARKLNQVSDFGKILDPMADSISRIAFFLSFTQPPINLPIFFVFIFYGRDAIISMLRTLCALNGFALAAQQSGKFKAFLQFIATFSILILMWAYELKVISIDTLQQTSISLVSLVAIFVLYSAFDYLYTNRVFMFRIIQKKNS